MALAAERTRASPAEVVNADSMLVYRGMDIGTAKPTLAERGGVPHHLIDIMDVHRERQRGRLPDPRPRRRSPTAARAAVVPILVGGSALYVHAILDEFDFPGTDPAVRARLEAELADVGAAALHGGSRRWPAERPPASCPATDAGSSGRWRSSS